MTFFFMTGTNDTAATVGTVLPIPVRRWKTPGCWLALNPVERNIILRHMWPLTVTPPKYREAYVIVMFDKYCSLMETFHKPVMELMEYQELTADLEKRLCRAVSGKAFLCAPGPYCARAVLRFGLTALRERTARRREQLRMPFCSGRLTGAPRFP